MSLFIFAFPLQKQWELWHFTEGVESQDLCLPLKLNRQKHMQYVKTLLQVCTNPWRKAGWKEGMVEGHHFCSLPWLSKSSRGPFSKPCTAGSVTRVKGALHVGKNWREDTETPQWSVPQEDLDRLKISPQALSCMCRSSPFHANHSTCRSLFQMITANNLED